MKCISAFYAVTPTAFVLQQNDTCVLIRAQISCVHVLFFLVKMSKIVIFIGKNIYAISSLTSSSLLGSLLPEIGLTLEMHFLNSWSSSEEKLMCVSVSHEWLICKLMWQRVRRGDVKFHTACNLCTVVCKCCVGVVYKLVCELVGSRSIGYN